MVPEQKPALEVALLEALLDLIDRCASGGGSLHGSEAFLGESWQHLLNCCLLIFYVHLVEYRALDSQNF